MLSAGVDVVELLWPAASLAVVASAWILGGGWIVRAIARSWIPRLTFRQSLLANAVAGIVFGALAAAISFAGRLPFDPFEMGRVYAGLAGYAIGFAVGLLVLRRMLGTRFWIALLAWTPTFFVPFLNPACLVAVGIPKTDLERNHANLVLCLSNLSGIGKHLLAHAVANRGQMPPDLNAVPDPNGVLPGLLCCPAVETTPPSVGRCDYFYHPADGAATSKRIVACDYRTNHGGYRRCVLLSDGTVWSFTEPQFQAELARPENAAFAEALRKAEGP